MEEFKKDEQPIGSRDEASFGAPQETVDDGRLSSEEVRTRQLAVAMTQYILSYRTDSGSRERFHEKFKEAYDAGDYAVCEDIMLSLIDARAAGFVDKSVSIEDFCDDALMFVDLGFKAIPTKYILNIFETLYTRTILQCSDNVGEKLQYVIDQVKGAGLSELAENLNTRKANLMKYAEGNNTQQNPGGPEAGS